MNEDAGENVGLSTFTRETEFHLEPVLF